MQNNSIAAFLKLLVLTCVSSPLLSASIQHLETNLLADLDGRCTGYSYVIYQNGSLVRSGSGGCRIDDGEEDGDELPFTVHTRKGVHSMSKTITATAILKALKQRGFDTTRPITADFPQDFLNAIQDGRIHLITYRDILRHESGFPEQRSFDASWSSIRQMISVGLVADPPALLGPGDEPTRNYSNRTYGLCRILVSTLLYREKWEQVQAQFPFLPFHGINPFAGIANNDYVQFVQAHVLKPAGVHGATTGPLRDPEDWPLYNFAKYHTFNNPSVEPILMAADYKHHVGGFGWAMSSWEYGRYLNALFDSRILSASSLAEMMSHRLGMGYQGSTNSYGHGGSNTVGSGAAGRCGWVHFDDENIQVVVQVNSSHNWFHATGLTVTDIIREAYQNTYSSPKAYEFEYPLHVFFRRQQDGFVVSRGVKGGDNATFRRRNFDRDWSSGWTHFRTFAAGGHSYCLHYKADNGNGSGRGHMRTINSDGTFGDDVFNHDNWRKGWTHIEFFERSGNDFLLLYNKNDRKLRILRMNNDGTIHYPRIVDTTAPDTFDILKIVNVWGEDKLFFHSTSSGLTRLHRFAADGSIDWNHQFQKTWSSAFTDFHFYYSNDRLFLCRYALSSEQGALRINEIIGSQFQSTPEIYDDANWHSNWQLMRFFTIDGKTFNFRYDPKLGIARMQAIKSNGKFNWEVVREFDELLRDFSASEFTGWTEIEFYRADSTGGSSGDPGESSADTLIVDFDNNGAGLHHARFMTAPADELAHPALEMTLKAETLDISWGATPDTMDICEVSSDLTDWTMHAAYLSPGAGGPTAPSSHSERIPRRQEGRIQDRLFTRVTRVPTVVTEERTVGPRMESPRLP